MSETSKSWILLFYSTKKQSIQRHPKVTAVQTFKKASLKLWSVYIAIFWDIILEICQLPFYKFDLHRYFIPQENYASRLSTGINALNKIELLPQLETLFKKACTIFSSVIKVSPKNDFVVVCKPDKVRGIVNVNKATYLQSVLAIINDRIYFEPIIKFQLLWGRDYYLSS